MPVGGYVEKLGNSELHSELPRWLVHLLALMIQKEDGWEGSGV